VIRDRDGKIDGKNLVVVQAWRWTMQEDVVKHDDMRANVRSAKIHPSKDYILARLRYSGWYFSGTTSAGGRADTERHWPVRGGCMLASLARCLGTAVILAPADVPPTMMPMVGSPERKDAFAAIHCKASQESSMLCGKWVLKG
jgi:hypothetical protein